MNQCIIGLTGGIGSGKTTVSKQFEVFGIDVVDADLVSHRVTAPGEAVNDTIADYFGPQVLQDSGALDRAWLRKRIFSEPADKQWLEALLHPKINHAITQALASSASIYTLFVSPLLVEAQLDSWCQEIIVVDMSPELQVKRTQARDNCSADTIRSIIDQQASREQRLAVAHKVIDNNGSLEQLQSQVSHLHNYYKTLAHKLAKPSRE